MNLICTEIVERESLDLNAFIIEYYKVRIMASDEIHGEIAISICVAFGFDKSPDLRRRFN